MKLNRIIRSTCRIAAVIALTVAAAGCGASDEGSGTSGSASPDAEKWADEAATRLTEYQADPGRINVSEPLPAKPAPGKSVHFLVLNLPTNAATGVLVRRRAGDRCQGRLHRGRGAFARDSR